MFEDQVVGELSEEQVYFRQLLIIQGLSTRIFSDVTPEWQINVRNYIESIKHFESTAVRHLDTEYKEKMGQIIKRARSKIIQYRKENPAFSYTNIGKEFEIIVSLDVARKRLALILRCLDHAGVFGERSYRAIKSGSAEGTDEEVVAVKQ